ncbi:unnamed protein product [Linum tenue]|uniref:Uncharacterized protein n=1 Tax=Linum tenue TaxID=586396 RepID=A0AAV0JDL5_9ROSI|nr:unnamed protein product [Linum tenue]
MAVFSLSSDNYFIRSADMKNDPDFFVYEYLHDPYDMAIVRRDGLSNEWGPRVRVGPSTRAKFGALEVFGVTIQGKLQWSDLANDLKLPGDNNYDGETMFRLLVNRRGLCFLEGVRTESFTVLRINDCFGWSRYGVKVPEFTSANVCNKCDMYTFGTVVDVRGAMLAAEEATAEVKVLRKEVEKGKLELAVCRKELECTKEMVEKSDAIESLFNKLVDEKEREVEEVKNQLVAFKAALASLVSSKE